LYRIESNWKSEISISVTGHIWHIISVLFEHVVSVIFCATVELVLWQLILTNAWWVWWCEQYQWSSTVLENVFLYSRSQDPYDGSLSPEYNQAFIFLYIALCLWKMRLEEVELLCLNFILQFLFIMHEACCVFVHCRVGTGTVYITKSVWYMILGCGQKTFEYHCITGFSAWKLWMLFNSHAGNQEVNDILLS
jgi:hypothetical protein